MTTTSNTSKLVPAAILFGDMKGSTKGAEEDERATVQQLKEYRNLTRQLVEGAASFYKVKFEGDGFMAVFDTPHDLVECGFRLQQEFRRRRWRIRLGGSYGAVYRDESGDVDGTDVNRAARIQARADASICEFLVSQTVADIVRNRVPGVCFEAHDPVEAPGVAEPLDVCVVASATDKRPATLPAKQKRSETAVGQPNGSTGIHTLGSHWQRSAGLATLILVAIALVSYFPVPRTTEDPPAPPLVGETVAVLEFENQKTEDTANGWCAKALQANLSTGLSEIEQLEVIALLRIKQHARRENLDVFEAARQLNVRRLVTGSYAVDSDQMRIDASVIDAQKGLQTAAWSVTGPRSAFFELQEDLRQRMLDKFNIQLTKAQKTKLETASLKTAGKSETVKKSRVDKYRLLLESEGVTSSPPPAPNVDPQAAVPQPPSWAGVGMPSAIASAALAQATPFASRQEVEQFLERYRVAYESADIPRLASFYISFPESQLRSVETYMESIDDLRVDLDDVEIQIGEHDASVTYTRRDTFIDKETEEEISLEIRLTRFLVRQGDELRFSSVE